MAEGHALKGVKNRRIGEAKGPKRGEARLGGSPGVEQRLQALLLRAFPLVRAEKGGVYAAHRFGVEVEPAPKQLAGVRLFRILQAATPPQQTHFARIGRKLVRLLKFQHLEPVLDIAQKNIRLAQRSAIAGRQQALALDFLQRRHRRPDAQFLAPRAMHQLQRSDDEFDFPNAAPAPFHIAPRGSAPLDLPVDAALQIGDFLQRFGSGWQSIHEMADQGLEGRCEGPRSGDQPRLGIRQALPGAGLRQKIVFGADQGTNQRAAFALGAQPHIDAIQKSFGAVARQLADQFLAQARKKNMVAQPPLPAAVRPFRLAFLGVDENQVDVGGKVQFPAAHLAHRQDAHLGGFPRIAFALRPAETPLEPPAHVAEKGKHDRLGQVRQLRRPFAQAANGKHIARAQAQQFLALKAAQGVAAPLRVLEQRHRRLGVARVFLERLGAAQGPLLQQPVEIFGIADQSFGEKAREAEEFRGEFQQARRFQQPLDESPGVEHAGQESGPMPQRRIGVRGGRQRGEQLRGQGDESLAHAQTENPLQIAPGGPDVPSPRPPQRAFERHRRRLGFQEFHQGAGLSGGDQCKHPE
ncbi:MAG: hypothetical protein BWZ10_01149 [candidate division BRC1 bacterium ADurb.BinA364]|nr:MAG: hypothetical protein BWZ10_01149 [candidate division BRC1 bacterium ADurb.BinA364]